VRFDKLVVNARPGNGLDPFESDVPGPPPSQVHLEWIQPITGPSVYDEFVKAHGEGFHHLAFEVKDMDEAIAHFKSKGVDVAQSGGWDSNGSK